MGDVFDNYVELTFLYYKNVQALSAYTTRLEEAHLKTIKHYMTIVMEWLQEWDDENGAKRKHII